MSRTIKFAKAGGPEVLAFIETQVPAPGPHEVRIRVKAIGINRADSMWRNDRYVESPKLPAGLGYEAAGIVDAVGASVTDLAVGDTVSTIPAFSLNQYSTYGEVILVPGYAVVKHPASLSFVEAASVWMMFITAYGALVLDAQVKSGDFVIIPAASSSVGLAAVQIANYAGATPIALTRTSEKTQRLHEAGASHVIVTQEQDMLAAVMRITDGNGARVVFDPVGGPNFPKLVAALTFEGIAYIYGALSEGDTSIPGAGDDPEDARDQGIQHPTGDGRRRAPEDRSRIRHQGPHEWCAQAGHRSYIRVRRDGGSAPLSGEQRPIR
jgi:NADPH:quinone reductase-like Zn-dependent oxidoreductase